MPCSNSDPRFQCISMPQNGWVEAWLLADERALSQVAFLRGRSGSVKPISGALEEIMNPKEELQKILSKLRLPDDENVYQEIASAAELDRIAERCPHFKEFCKRVHEC